MTIITNNCLTKDSILTSFIRLVKKIYIDKKTRLLQFILPEMGMPPLDIILFEEKLIETISLKLNFYLYKDVNVSFYQII